MSKKLTDSKWTEEEISVIYKHKSMSAKELSKLIHSHSVTGIAAKIKRLKIKPSKKWTKNELDILRDNCNSPNLHRLLPNRSHVSILKAKIRYGYGDHSTREKWTDFEIAVLQRHAGNMLSNELIELLPGRTISAIKGRCFNLHIKKTPECISRQGRLSQAMQVPGSLLTLDQKITLDDLEETVQQVLLGSVLGDGSCTKTGGRYIIFSEAHGWKQKDYIVWKRQIFKDFQPSYSETATPRIRTPSHVIFAKLRSAIYENKNDKNRLPASVIEKLNYLGLLIWYLDDGYLGRPKNGLKSNGKIRQTYPHIVAKGYRLNDLKTAFKLMNSRMGMNSYVNTHAHKGSLNKMVCLNNDKHWLFPIWHELASTLKLPECMLYKLDDRNLIEVSSQNL